MCCCVITLLPDSSPLGGGEDLEAELPQWLGSTPAVQGAAQQNAAPAAHVLLEPPLMPPSLLAVV